MSDVALVPANAPFEPGDIPYALAQVARLHEGVKAEFDLIAGRMSWLVIAESFMFSAFAAASSSYRTDHPLIRELQYLIVVLPFVGMFLSACVYTAILAAHRAIGILKYERDRMIARLPSGLRIDLISNESQVQWWGNVPTHIIPPVLFLIWFGAIVFVFV